MPCNGDCNQGRECTCECKKETKMMKHKWAKEIHAWADGAKIEEYNAGIWYETDYPAFTNSALRFRIKSRPKQPKYLYAYIFNGDAMLTETKAVAANGARYIGKIEVQDD